MIYNLFLALFLLLASTAMAHSGKPSHHVVVETDGSDDDFGAICLLLANPEIVTIGIVIDNTLLESQSIISEIDSLLHNLYHEGIAVVAEKDAGAFLDKCAQSYPNDITLVSLGKSSVFTKWISKDGSNKDNVKKIIVHSSSMDEGLTDLKALSCNSPVYVVENRSNIFFPCLQYAQKLINVNSPYARQIQRCWHIDYSNIKSIGSAILPVYFSCSILFEKTHYNGIKTYKLQSGIPNEFVFEIVKNLLTSRDRHHGQTFKKFPIDSSLYDYHIAPHVSHTIKKYGMTEWKAVCMTNDIHGHTGIYSIVGAKMGIRALEYFNVGVNSLEVISFAGSKPPLSCFNDGLQISSGATIGQGLISISDSVSKIPSAVFEFNDSQIHICVKPTIAAKMQRDIKYGITAYGLKTPAYWRYIETMAIRYWTEFDRHNVFDITKINE
ncbi:FmdE family protein [Bacteroidales bacterium]|nr:FmdE family protein [Bacteroidales bacterium]